MSDHGPGSNYTDGSDRQIIRAVAQSCGYQLFRITDNMDFFTRQAVDAMVSVECEYESEPGDIYCRKLRAGFLRSDHGTHSMWGQLDNTIEMLRGHQRQAWQTRLDAARREQVNG